MVLPSVKNWAGQRFRNGPHCEVLRTKEWAGNAAERVTKFALVKK